MNPKPNNKMSPTMRHLATSMSGPPAAKTRWARQVCGNDLAKAKKLPLAFGYTDHNRNVFVGRAFKDRLECDEVRNIEMTNRNSLVSRLRKDFT